MMSMTAPTPADDCSRWPGVIAAPSSAAGILFATLALPITAQARGNGRGFIFNSEKFSFCAVYKSGDTMPGTRNAKPTSGKNET
jgi:hypothetical protein